MSDHVDTALKLLRMAAPAIREEKSTRLDGPLMTVLDALDELEKDASLKEEKEGSQMLGKPYTDVRIEIPDISLYDLRPALPGLMTINLYPPASSDREIELVFGTAEGCDPAREDFLSAEVERITQKQVLAIRTREE